MKKPRRLAPIDLDRAFRDPALLGAALGDPSTWSAWMTVLRSAFGLELDEAQAQLFVEIAGGRQPPPKRVRELWAIVSRRCGKSKMAAGIAVFHATMMPQKVSSGEKPVVLVLASTQDQSRVVFDYALSFLQSSRVLQQEIVDYTRSEIRLKNGVTIAIHSNSFRSIRGRTVSAVIFDEVAFWRDESSAAPDIETYRAVLPH